MTGADLLIEARRRAGLSQSELAARIRRPQPTISRWESGAMEPGFAALRDAVRACGFELDVSLAKGDGSYSSLIEKQLRITPRARLLRTGGRQVERLLRGLADSKALFVLVGSHAAAAQGSPLSASPHISIVPNTKAENVQRLTHALSQLGAETSQDRRADFAFEMPDGVRILAEAKPPGTHGYRDLARHANRIALGRSELSVASVVDLLRISDASPDPEDRLMRPALQELLEVNARSRRSS